MIGDAKLEPAECRFFAANGTVINVVGEVMVDVRVGEFEIPTRFVVSDNITEPMLGINWLRHNRMIWDFAKDILLVSGKVFHLVTSDSVEICRRVVAVGDTVVPARSQAIIPGRVERNRMSGEPIDHVWTTDIKELKACVTVARAILPERLEDIPVLVLNSSDAPCCVRGETILLELSLAKCVDDIGNLEENVASSENGVAKSYEHMSKL